MNRTVTQDGYIVIPERVELPGQRIRGVECGKCRLRFEYGQSIGFACSQGDCPLGLASPYQNTGTTCYRPLG